MTRLTLRGQGGATLKILSNRPNEYLNFDAQDGYIPSEHTNITIEAPALAQLRDYLNTLDLPKGPFFQGKKLDTVEKQLDALLTANEADREVLLWLLRKAHNKG